MHVAGDKILGDCALWIHLTNKGMKKINVRNIIILGSLAPKFHQLGG
jgi:hypothetical protein